MTITWWFKFGRKFTATHAGWFPDWVVNWFIDKEEEALDKGEEENR